MVLNETKCRLPWMSPIEFGNDHGLCNNTSSYIEALGVWNKAFKLTCPKVPKCKRSFYETNLEENIVQASTNGAKLKIQLMYSEVQTVEDSVAYDAQSFVGEVGGTMGLLLGLSFLSAFDFIDHLLMKFA